MAAATARPALSVWVDYVCPFCLLAEEAVFKVAQSHSLPITWQPFELRPFPTPTLKPEDPYLPTVWARSVYPSAERLGVPIRLPSVSPQPYTHTAFEGFQYADKHGKGTEWTMGTMRAFFQQDRDIGKIDELVDIGRSIGLDPAELRQALEDRRYQQAHVEAREKAYARGVRAVPTIEFKGRVFSGVPSVGELEGFVREGLGEGK